MAQVYTVKGVMKTGKSNPTYGTEYYVQFNESENSFAMWFKKDPEVGQQIEGDIEGSKFKKAKKEWNANQTASAGTRPATSPTTRSRDNSDGMRQGMCINNAANYVNALEFPKALTDREWATLVHDYASALYALGDLKSPEDRQATTAAEVFSGN